MERDPDLLDVALALRARAASRACYNGRQKDRDQDADNRDDDQQLNQRKSRLDGSAATREVGFRDEAVSRTNRRGALGTTRIARHETSFRSRPIRLIGVARVSWHGGKDPRFRRNRHPTGRSPQGPARPSET